jgi:hypothetical protein
VAEGLRVGVAAALAVAVAAAVVVAAPGPGHAASGVFLWTDGSSGLVTPIPFPANEKCFATFKATRAQNWTDSDAVLNGDGLCYDAIKTLKPGESYDGEFGAVGFTNPGATGG